MFNWTANKDLVPKSSNEVKERDTSHQRIKWTRETSTSTEGSTSGARPHNRGQLGVILSLVVVNFIN